ncbi:MAG TPA: PQQ-binding-like beta-propeller repeat protein [Polyangiales bacterium]|nr:PQQ-binding-like beta-propeller repeat protein [Polyangiales bacterium]
MRVAMGARRVACVLAWALAGAVACDDDKDSTAPPQGSEGSDAATDAGADAGAKPPARKASWTMMGGDARNTYHNPLETRLHAGNAKDLKLKWSFEVAGFPPGSPLIVEGAVYVMATGGTYAIGLEKGDKLWERTDIAGTASVAYADGAVYLHTSRAQLWKLNAADGGTIWGPIRTYELPSCDGTSSPILAGDKVLVGHSCGGSEVTGNADQDVARGGVEAFAIADGSRIWTYFTVPESGENGAMVWSSVGVDLEANVVFATTGNNYTMLGENSDAFHAIDLETGERVWKRQVREGDVWSRGSKWFMAPSGANTDTDFGANPIVAELNGRKLVAAGNKGSGFWALDRETGEVVWGRTELSSTNSPAYGGVLMNGAFDGKNFYAAVNQPPRQSLLRVLNGETGEDVLPPLELNASVWGAPSLANGLIFVPVNSVLKVFDAASFEELVAFDTGGTIAAGAPAVVDGNVVVGSGLMYGFAQDALNNNKVLCYALDGTGGTGSSAESGKGAPTWSAIYDEIIVASGCSGAALCHGGETGLGNLAFKSKSQSYDALVGVKAMGTSLNDSKNCADVDILRVSAGKADESLLVQKLEGTQPCGDSMPPGGKLSAAQLQQVRMWVQNGAKND